MDFLKRFALTILKPALITWLGTRALRLPEVDANRVATQLRIPVEAIRAIEAELLALAVKEIDKI